MDRLNVAVSVLCVASYCIRDYRGLYAAASNSLQTGKGVLACLYEYAWCFMQDVDT